MIQLYCYLIITIGLDLYSNGKLPSVWSAVYDMFSNLLWVTWPLFMFILAKLAPNCVNSLVVCEFGCAIFQTVDVLMHDKLTIVKLEAENRMAVCNF